MSLLSIISIKPDYFNNNSNKKNVICYQQTKNTIRSELLDTKKKVAKNFEIDEKGSKKNNIASHFKIKKRVIKKNKIASYSEIEK